MPLVSTPVLVGQWHGREWHGSLRRLRDTVPAVRQLLAGEKVNGFRLRLEAPAASTSILVRVRSPFYTGTNVS